MDRLALLERFGVIVATPQRRGRGYVYELTASGRELKRVCDVMGEWGARWLEIEPHHLDPLYALWATSRLVDLSAVPRHGVVVRFALREAPNRHFWMLLQRPRVELCTSYPGRDEDLVVTTDASTLASWNLRRVSFADAMRQGRIRVEGPPSLVKSFPQWLRASPFAAVRPVQRSQ